jgi:hypothetical protein
MYTFVQERAAGPQLDAAVAQLVMGWTHMRLSEGGSRREFWVNPDGGAKRLAANFKPSSDFQTAWNVIVKLFLKRGYQFELQTRDDGKWQAVFARPRPEPEPPAYLIGDGDTPEVAICDAAIGAAYEARRDAERRKAP